MAIHRLCILSVQVREVDSEGASLTEYESNHTYYLESIAKNGADRMSHSHWTTFSFGPTGSSKMVEVEVSMQSGSISNYEFRPTHVHNISQSGGKLTFQIESNKYTAIIINGDIRNPLFIFADPVETNVPDSNGESVYVVEKGSTTKEAPLTIRDKEIKRLFISRRENILLMRPMHLVIHHKVITQHFLCALIVVQDAKETKSNKFISLEEQLYMVILEQHELIT